MRSRKGYSQLLDLFLSAVLSVSFLIICIVSLGAVLTYVFVPNLPDTATDYLLKPYNNQDLKFEETQINRLNTAYANSSHEKGYCFNINDGQVTGLVNGKVKDSSTRQITFECPARYEGRLHTHPGLFTTASLSEQDKDAFIVDTVISHRIATCILSGQVHKYQNPDVLNCFRLDGKRDFSRFQISIQSG